MQWLIIVGLACAGPLLNKMYVKRATRRQRVVVRREELRRIINMFYDEQERQNG